MKNEEALKRLREEYNEDYLFIKDIIDNKVIPDSLPKEMYESRYGIYNFPTDISWIFAFRDVYTKNISWSIVTKNWVEPFAEFLKGKRCIEIMAGKGYLSYALQSYGVNITPSDNYSWGYDESTNFTKVENLSAKDAIKKYKGRLDYVICSWPPYKDTDICDAIKAIAKYHPESKLIYIGESYGGCTGCDDMWDLLYLTPAKSKETRSFYEATLDFESFYSVHDTINLFEIDKDKAKKYVKKKKGDKKK